MQIVGCYILNMSRWLFLIICFRKGMCFLASVLDLGCLECDTHCCGDSIYRSSLGAAHSWLRAQTTRFLIVILAFRSSDTFLHQNKLFITVSGLDTYIESYIGSVTSISVQTLIKTVIQTPQKVHGCFENAFQKILGLFEAFVLPF